MNGTYKRPFSRGKISQKTEAAIADYRPEVDNLATSPVGDGSYSGSNGPGCREGIQLADEYGNRDREARPVSEVPCALPGHPASSTKIF